MTARAPDRRIQVAVLGATGAVGQTFVRLLEQHPWLELAEVTASERSAGRTYADAARWIEGEMPESAAGLRLLHSDPSQVHSQIVFSALDSSVAGEIEADFAKAGKIVLSNARNHRMDPDVPLVIPEVNADHMDLIEFQRRSRGWTGAIITNANCAATVAAVALAPLHQRFGIEKLVLTTLQAVSGAGYPGVPSLDIVGNVIPYIADEEDKIEREMRKLLGSYSGDAIQEAPFSISAQANRVPVQNGHLVCISASFREEPSVSDAIGTLREWRGTEITLDLPGRPQRVLAVTDAPDRPQPRRDVDAGNGMTVTVGRVRADPVMHLRMVALGHNTVRGAAGGSLLNAELLIATGRTGGV